MKKISKRHIIVWFHVFEILVKIYQKVWPVGDCKRKIYKSPTYLVFHPSHKSPDEPFFYKTWFQGTPPEYVYLLCWGVSILWGVELFHLGQESDVTVNTNMQPKAVVTKHGNALTNFLYLSNISLCSLLVSTSGSKTVVKTHMCTIMSVRQSTCHTDNISLRTMSTYLWITFIAADYNAINMICKHTARNQNKKPSYCKQNARSSAQTVTSLFGEGSFPGEEAYGTPMMAATAGRINFSVE